MGIELRKVNNDRPLRARSGADFVTALYNSEILSDLTENLRKS